MRDPTSSARSQDDLDEVAQAALDSFPASDPPGWPGLRLGPPAAQFRRDPDRPDDTRTADTRPAPPLLIDDARTDRHR